jgi:hypothetical protein
VENETPSSHGRDVMSRLNEIRERLAKAESVDWCSVIHEDDEEYYASFTRVGSTSLPLYDDGILLLAEPDIEEFLLNAFADIKYLLSQVEGE